MDLAQAHRTIEDAVAPATADLGRKQARAAGRIGLHGGIQALPRFAVVLTLGWLGASYVTGAPLFPPLALPLILLVVPFGMALSVRSAARRRSRIDARTAALVLDRNNATKDRLSAALELSENPATAGGDRRAALARAAVQDGVDTVRRVDLSRTQVPEPALRFHTVSVLLALLIALVPAVLRIGPGDNAAAKESGGPVASSDDRTGQDGERADETDGRSEEPPHDTAREERPDSRDARARDERRPEDRPRDPDTTTEPRQPRGAGAGAAGTEAAGERGQRAPTAGDTKAANTGAATASGQGGGGQGAAKSETPSEDSEQERRAQAPRSQKPKKPSETEGGEQERSAGNPSGPSRGGGRMAAVGNQRSGMERGRDRDDDPETDDEEVEDEKEETEQRGGIMPMTRDRMRAAARELSISGNGPPDDGRGGPTPPKKSRGTASLVLGIRLPDQIRGQPNPGTAKTTIEQIPPVPQAEPPRPAAAAPSPGPSPHVQSEAAPLGDLAEAIRRYHELLRGSRAEAPAPEPQRDE